MERTLTEKGCQMGVEPTTTASTVRRSAIELLAPYFPRFYHEGRVLASPHQSMGAIQFWGEIWQNRAIREGEVADEEQ